MKSAPFITVREIGSKNFGSRSRPNHFIRAFRKPHFIGPCVTVFGSVRFVPTNPYYQRAEEVGKELSEPGFAVMTGGGHGIMEAANEGAFENGGY